MHSCADNSIQAIFRLTESAVLYKTWRRICTASHCLQLPQHLSAGKVFWLTANKCGCNYVALFIMCIFLCFHRVILVILQAVVALKESDYFKVRVPNAIQPQKETVLKMVEVSLAF